MQSLEILRSGGYRGSGLTKLKLTERLSEFPREILDEKYGVARGLEILDLSGTGLASIPPEFGHCLPNLKIAFFSGCSFSEFPAELATCPKLEMVAFRSNRMTSWGDVKDSGTREPASFPFPPRLRWLILTDNDLDTIPESIGCCERLEKCMLAGNRLHCLPSSMANCKNLTLLRLAANNFDALPEWLAGMPKLAFLSFAGNPYLGAAVTSREGTSTLPLVDWDSIEIQHVLGEGASGIISQGVIQDSPWGNVAVKVFRGALTSDGTPHDEMAACLAAGQHDNLVRVHGQVRWSDGGGDKESKESRDQPFKGGLVMELIPSRYRVLGLPPSFESCTRDCFSLADVSNRKMSMSAAFAILQGIASAAGHLHERGIAHGDLYAHNILVSTTGELGSDAEKTHAILSDFGASTVYRRAAGRVGNGCPMDLERLEVLAFGYLVDDLLRLVSSSVEGTQVKQLSDLRDRCTRVNVHERPRFTEISVALAQVK